MQERTFQDILSESWRIYTGYFRHILLLAALVFLPLNLIMEFGTSSLDVLFESPEIFNQQTGEVNISLLLENVQQEEFSTSLWIGAGTQLISFVATIFISIMVTWIVVAARKNEEVEMGLVFQKSLLSFVPVCLTGLLSFLFLVPLFLLFIAPGVLFSVYWIFAGMAVVLREKTYLHALRYSKQLVSGHWWQLFWRILLLGVALFIVLPVFFSPTIALMDTVPGIEALVNTIFQIFAMFFSVFLVVYFFYLEEMQNTATK